MQMVYAILDVVQYRARDGGGCGHWAFHLKIRDGETIENIVLQVTDLTGRCEFEELDADPMQSARYIKSIQITDAIDAEETIEDIKRVLKKVPIGKALGWTCQDWIIECVDKLYEEGLIGDHEADTARDELEADYRDF